METEKGGKEALKIALADGGNPANKGDAACYLGSLLIVQEAFPEAEIAYFSDNPDRAERDYGVKPVYWSKFACPHSGLARLLPHDKLRLAYRAFRTALWFATDCDGFLTQQEKQSFKAKRECDVYISKCGGNINDYYWSGMYYNLLWYWLLKRRGVKVVILAQSIDPIHNKIYRFLLRHVLNKLDLITVRDSLSLESLKDLKVDLDKVHVTADLSFLVHDVDTRIAVQRPAVCISTRYWKWNKNEFGYRVAIVKIAEYLTSRGYHVYFLSTGWANPYSDKDYAKKLASMVLGDVEVIEKEPTLGELRMTLIQFDFVISTRMHLGVLAMSMGVPAIYVYYEEKAHGLLKDLGLEQFAVDINKVSACKLGVMVNCLLDSYGKIVVSLVEGVAGLRRKAWGNVEFLRRAVNG